MFLAVINLGILALGAASVLTENLNSQQIMWEKFKLNYNRSYSTQAEEETRFGFFVENLKLIDKRNSVEVSAGGNAVHGITKFADVSQMEFEKLFLSRNIEKSIGAIKAEIPRADSESLVDWTGILTTPVKDSEQCGRIFCQNNYSLNFLFV